MTLIQLANKHRENINNLLWIISASPIIYIALIYFYDKSLINPFEFLMNQTGHWAMALFLMSYAITPVRRWLCFIAQRAKWRCGKRLSDWNILIYNRRMLGVSGYYYATAHLIIYLYLELGFDWVEFCFDIRSRTHVLLGVLGWLLLTIMAITSPCAIQKILRQYWRKIHRITYPAAALLCCHLITEAKTLSWDLVTYSSLALLLTLHRIYVWTINSRTNQRDDGMMIER